MSSTATPASLSCPQCGAKGLEFAPDAQKLQCTYCGWQGEVETVQAEITEHAYRELRNWSAQPQVTLAAQEIQCPSCGAVTTFDPTRVADRCAFCGTHLNVQPKSASPVVAPQAVIPFAVARQPMFQRLLQWLGKNWFAPNDLKKLAEPESIQGIYLPFWTFDSQTRTFYRGERGEYYYTTERYQDSEGNWQTREVRHTRWYRTSGWVERFFDDVLVAATQSVPVQRLERLLELGYSASALKPYDDRYLAGYQVERYQVTPVQAWERAKEKMDRVIESDICSDIGRDEQRILEKRTSYDAITFKHILLPVWLFSYRYRGRTYQVMGCGITGRIFGDRPISVWKVLLAILGALLALGIGIWAVQMAESQNQPPPPRQEQPSPY
ncbi:MAG: hypothetical protein RMI89_01270 [Gloeomargarita sp. SKYBB_i_bin120]|nr:hypothetical protein [Gloeomargarita sp. SKYB120]MDW8177152.1 hypothetical protein [Gloeomargarita sp. SKYBB_i_bin120]